MRRHLSRERRNDKFYSSFLGGVLRIHPSIRLSVHTSMHPLSHRDSSSLSVECLLHLPTQPRLVWGDLRGEIANPNFEHESASRGKASWIPSLFLMIIVQSVWPQWWKCQPAYLSGTAWRWGGKPVTKTTRTCFEIRRMQLLCVLAGHTRAYILYMYVRLSLQYACKQAE